MGKGGADTSFETAKWSTIATTFITLIIGAALIGVGVYGLLNPLGSAWVPTTLPILSIIIGAVVFLISLVGFFAAVAEFRTFVYIYFGVLLVLVIFQYLIGVLALTNRGNFINNTLDSRWTDLYEHKPRYIRDVEDHYGCCGLFNTTDRAYPKPYSSNVTIPLSCVDDPNYGYHDPCIAPIKKDWEDRQTTFGIGILVLATIQFLGLIPTYYLATRLAGNASERDALLREEHRRLIADNPQNPATYGGLADGRVQHPVGGPAGAYHASSGRPGSRG